MIQDLPTEILNQFFDRLPDELEVRLVCKRWNQVMEAVNPVQQVFVNPLFLQNLIDDFAEYPTFAPKVKKLVLVDSFSGGGRKMNYSLRMFHSIRTTLTSTSYYGDMLELVIRECKNLSHIKMESIFPKGRGGVMNGIIDQLHDLTLQGQLNLERLEMNSIPTICDNYLDVEKMMICFDEHSLKPRHFVLVTTSTSYYYHKGSPPQSSLSVVNDDIYNGTNYLTSTVVHLVHPTIMISRESLNFIASGGIKGLDVLYISLKVDNTVTAVDAKKLRAYCQASLKTYNIYLRRSSLTVALIS